MAKKKTVSPLAVSPQRMVRRSEQFVSIYANDTQIQTTPWDVRLVFGQIETPSDGDMTLVEVKQIADVRMSPQHAKRITQILLDQLRAYEEKMGPIPQVD